MQSSSIESSDVAIFWDYENCHASSQTSGYEVAAGIRNVAHRFGSVKHFKAYMELPDSDTFRSLSLRSELQSSGVSLTDCPHNGRKNVADQMIMVDMLAYAMDHPTPATLILISGDRDFAYAVSVLRLRRYQVVASVWLDWNADVMGYSNSPPNLEGVAESTAPIRSPSSSVQSPIARRASILTGSDSPYARVGQPLAATKPLAAPAVVASSEPSASPSGRTESHKEPTLQHPLDLPAEPEQPEVASVPAPAYSPKSNAIPTTSSLGSAAANTTPASQMPAPALPPIRSQSSTGQLWPTPVSSSPVLFSDDLISAHIRRCMDMVAEVQPSSLPIPIPSTTTNIQSPNPAILTPHDHVAFVEPNPMSTQIPTFPKTVPPVFESLVESLEKQKAKGIPRPLRSTISVDIIGKDKKLYKKAGVEKFSQFVALAEKAKIIELGGREGPRVDFAPS